MFVSFLNEVYGQTPSYPLVGPYTDYPGEYHIRTAIHFDDGPGWPSDPNDLNALGEDVLNVLNDAFGEFGIYFHTDGGCNAIVDRNASNSLDNLDRMDINIFHKTVLPAEGTSGGLPGTRVTISGLGPTDASFNTVLLHEMGHCLGLFHIFTDPNVICEENDPLAPCTSSNICDCCGDSVCDTPTTYNDYIFVSSDCSASIPPGVDPAIFTNYMAYVDSQSLGCQDHFTPGQGQRMRAMLEEAPTLQAILHRNINNSNSPLLSGTYGNLIIESGSNVEINSPIEMMPGTYIYVEKGARLTVRSTISGACDEMWRGIRVDGSVINAQTNTGQGFVMVRPSGVIEHAEIGIDVEGKGPNSGGGIVKGIFGTFQNNKIGLRFASYGSGGTSVNAFFFMLPKFFITDDYRGEDVRPVMIRAEGIRQPKIIGGKFHDQRTTCSNPLRQAVGIELWNASIHLSGQEFENLSIGVYADQINDENGSFSVKQTNFINCVTGIHTEETSSFSITHSDFDVLKPTACPDNPTLMTRGIFMQNMATDFKVEDNSFNGIFDILAERTVGIYTFNTGEGMGKRINENNFTNMYEGLLAEQSNAGGSDGLLYLCNTFVDGIPWGNGQTYYDIHVPLGGTVANRQSGPYDFNEGYYLPAGNVFSNSGGGFSFYYDVVVGPSTPLIDYYYNENGVNEDPGTSSSGINPEEVDASAGCSVPTTPEIPCGYPPYPDCDEIIGTGGEDGFYMIENLWQIHLANLPNIIDSVQLEAEWDTIHQLRRDMNKFVSGILQQYTLDTNEVKVDSIVTWLDRTETYSADMRLARHYFFTYDFNRFDALWPQIPTKYGFAPDANSDYNGLDMIFNLVRPHLQAEAAIKGMNETILDSLDHWSDWCTSPGSLSRSLLRRNGINIELNCSGSGQNAQQMQGHHTSEDNKNSYVAQLKIHPNPANSEIIVSLPERATSNGIVEVYNMQGHLVSSYDFLKETHTIALNVTDLPNGFYFIKSISTNTTYQSGKVLINH